MAISDAAAATAQNRTLYGCCFFVCEAAATAAATATASEQAVYTKGFSQATTSKLFTQWAFIKPQGASCFKLYPAMPAACDISCLTLP